MDRLDQAELRFEELLRRAERELAAAAKKRADAVRSLDVVERVEKRTENAIRQLRDIIRQGEGDANG